MNKREARSILNLADNYSEEELQKKYKDLAKKFHPDNGVTGDEHKFIEVKEAYEFLCNDVGDKSDDSESGDMVCCPRCHGKGKINEKQRGSRGIIIERVKCPLCKGTGKTQ